MSPQIPLHGDRSVCLADQGQCILLGMCIYEGWLSGGPDGGYRVLGIAPPGVLLPYATQGDTTLGG